MNIKLKIRGFRKIKPRYIGLLVAIITLVVTSNAVFRHFREARGEAGFNLFQYTFPWPDDPSALQKYTFKAGEQGIVWLSIPINLSASTVPVTANLVITEKIPSQVSYDSVVEVFDWRMISDGHGGYIRRPLAYTVTGPTNGKLTFTINNVPSRRDSTNNTNVVFIKLKFTAKQSGVFDFTGNFNQCETGNPVQVSSQSSVQYYWRENPSNNHKYDFWSRCSVIEGNPINIIKTTYLDKDGCKSQCSNSCQRKANFEAGEKVLTSLVIDEPNESRTDYKIQDTLPKTVSGEIIYSLKREKDGFCKTDLRATVSDGKIEFQGSADQMLLNGKNIIEYSYKI